MNIIEQRLQQCRSGARIDYASKSDFWFASRPVQTGALGTGPIRFGCWLWRNQCMGVTIYQDLDVIGPSNPLYAEMLTKRDA